jgi:hypothetical protein
MYRGVLMVVPIAIIAISILTIALIVFWVHPWPLRFPSFSKGQLEGKNRGNLQIF